MAAWLEPWRRRGALTCCQHHSSLGLVWRESGSRAAPAPANLWELDGPRQRREEERRFAPTKIQAPTSLPQCERHTKRARQSGARVENTGRENGGADHRICSLLRVLTLDGAMRIAGGTAKLQHVSFWHEHAQQTVILQQVELSTPHQRARMPFAGYRLGACHRQGAGGSCLRAQQGGTAVRRRQQGNSREPPPVFRQLLGIKIRSGEQASPARA